LIYLDLDWATCRSSLLGRGSESSKQMDPIKAERNFTELLSWAEQYWTRSDLRSHTGHLRLFSDFLGVKRCFKTREEVNRYIETQKIIEPATPANRPKADR
jgi:hypothetical protein